MKINDIRIGSSITCVPSDSSPVHLKNSGSPRHRREIRKWWTIGVTREQTSMGSQGTVFSTQMSWGKKNTLTPWLYFRSNRPVVSSAIWPHLVLPFLISCLSPCLYSFLAQSLICEPLSLWFCWSPVLHCLFVSIALNLYSSLFLY